MAIITMPPISTNKEIDHAKGPDKKEDQYVYPMGNGLRLIVTVAGTKTSPDGTKTFRYRKTFQYRFRLDGKQNIATLGTYPTMQLAAARKALEEARELVKQGINPNAAKRAQKQANLEAQQAQARQEAEEQAALERRFRNVAEKWHKQRNARLEPQTQRAKWNCLKLHVFPTIGDIPIDRITRKALVELLLSIEAKVSPHTAHRTASRIYEVFTFAQNSGLIDANPATNLKSVLQKHVTEHRKSLDIERLPALFQELSLDNPKKNGLHDITKAAAWFDILTAARPGEVWEATWDEIDLDAAQWNVSAERMKMRRPHTVPLSRQAVALLERLKEWYGQGKYIFSINGEKHISADTVRAAVQRLGFDTTIHGFRKIFMTEAKKLGVFIWQAVSAALSHKTSTNSDAPYDESDYLELRKPIMQWYADWLEAMQKSGNFENPADYLPHDLPRAPQGR